MNNNLTKIKNKSQILKNYFHYNKMIENLIHGILIKIIYITNLKYRVMKNLLICF